MEPPSATPREGSFLKAPEWGWNVDAYLFAGGIAGGLGIIAAVARPDRREERRLRRTARFAALALAAASPALLISHLGRPERFLNMLRIVKLKSPMSLGVWGLLAYSTVAAATAARELAECGVLPGVLRRFVPALFTPLQALLGAFLCSYTGVLLSATANPLWSAGKRHIPIACVASGIGGACALVSLLCTLEGNRAPVHRLERLGLLAAGLEWSALLDFRRIAGATEARAMFDGARGRRLREVTLIGGTLVPAALEALAHAVALPQPVDAARSLLGAALTLVGGYVFRETLVEAGKDAVRNRRATP